MSNCVGGDCPTIIPFELGGKVGYVVQGESFTQEEDATVRAAISNTGVGSAATEVRVFIPAETLERFIGNRQVSKTEGHE